MTAIRTIAQAAHDAAMADLEARGRAAIVDLLGDEADLSVCRVSVGSGMVVLCDGDTHLSWTVTGGVSLVEIDDGEVRLVAGPIVDVLDLARRLDQAAD